jgi:hypothetical protein
LRDAATKLREVAKHVADLPEPSDADVAAMSELDFGAIFISPPVALALADWLDACASQEERLNGGPGHGPTDPYQRWRPHQYDEALAVADAILGSDS